MADKHLQFLDIPRREPDKLGIEVRTKQFREIYSQYSAESAAQQRSEERRVGKEC